ncbi:MAG: S8 family serine peptidase, partial [Actinobacteria bacterium]|nr:S8 family serine peptidase [Actinomycetota bacterium]
RTYSCGAGGDDDHYHGTHVAGTIAALDDGEGVVGVAPGARLWAVKVLDSSGSGSFSVIIAGVDYVTANAGEIDVANMSLGCKCTSTALDDALTTSVAAGVTYAISAGNSDADTKDFSPAGHDDVITVSALADFDGLAGGLGAPTCRTDQDDTLADFSNWGPDVDITAPGVCILSTYPLEQGGYASISGTSMSSPHVAGAAALLYASGMSDPALVKSTLQAEGNVGWTDDSPDGVTEKLLDVSDSTVFAPVPAGDPDPTAPPAPTDFDAVAVSSSEIALTWTDVDGETHYELSIDGGAPIELAAGTVSYAHTGLTASTLYGYSLTAVNGTLASAPVSDSATTLAADGGGTDPSGIDLTASGSKVKGEKSVDLTWIGATSTTVDVFRDGSKVAANEPNNGAYTESLGKGGGTYTYRVCEAGTTVCSNDATVTF